MSKDEKLKRKLLTKPKGFTYQELVSVLQRFGFTKDNKGKTTGSKVKFYNQDNGDVIHIHRPHPGNEVKSYVLSDIIKYLKEKGYL